MYETEEILQKQNWNAETLFNYGRYHDIESQSDLFWELVEKVPDPPHGWIVCDNENEIISGPYWNQEDATADLQIYCRESNASFWLTKNVGHEELCQLLQTLLTEL